MLAVTTDSGLLSLVEHDSLEGAASHVIASTRVDHADGLAWTDDHVLCSGRTFDCAARSVKEPPSPGNAQLIRLGTDGTLFLARGRELHAWKPGAKAPHLLQRHPAPIAALALSDERVAACSLDGPVLVNELPSTLQRALSIESKGKVTTLAFSRSRRGLLACGDSLGAIHILQPGKSMSVLRTLDALRGRPLQAMAFSPLRPHILFALTRRGLLVEFDVDRKAVVSKARLAVTAIAMALATDGRRLAIGTSDGTVLFKDPLDLSKPAVTVVCDEGNAISQLAFKPVPLPVSPNLASVDRFRSPHRAMRVVNFDADGTQSDSGPMSPAHMAARLHRAASVSQMRSPPPGFVRRATTPDIVVRGASPPPPSGLGHEVILSPPMTPSASASASEAESYTFPTRAREAVLSHRRERGLPASSSSPAIYGISRTSSSDGDALRAARDDTPRAAVTRRASASTSPLVSPALGTAHPITTLWRRASDTSPPVTNMKEFRSEIKTRGGRVENVRQAWSMRVAVDRSTFEELRRLQAENAALKAENTALKAETRMLRAREGREPRRA